MATTATVTLNSDISSGFGGISKTMTLTKAGTNNDITETTGFSRRKLAAANKKKREATRKGKQHARHGLHKGKRK